MTQPNSTGPGFAPEKKWEPEMMQISGERREWSHHLPFSAGINPSDLPVVETSRGPADGADISCEDAAEESFSSKDLPLAKGHYNRPESVNSANLDEQLYQSIFIPKTSFILNPNHFVYNYWWWFIVFLTYWNLAQV